MVGLNGLFCMYIHAIQCQPEAFSQQSETYLMSEVEITNKEVSDFTRPLMCFFTQPCSVWYLEYLKEGRRCGIKERMRWAAEVISQRLIPHSRVEILEPNWATGRQMRRRERKTAKDGITSPKWNPQNDVAWHAMLGNHTAAHPKNLILSLRCDSTSDLSRSQPSGLARWLECVRHLAPFIAPTHGVCLEDGCVTIRETVQSFTNQITYSSRNMEQ